MPCSNQLRGAGIPQGSAGARRETPNVWNKVGIDSQIVTAEEFNPMPIRIQKVQEQGIADPMATEAAFDIPEITGCREKVTAMYQVAYARNPPSEVVQALASAIRKRDIMNASLSLQPHRPQGIFPPLTRVLGETEPNSLQNS